MSLQLLIVSMSSGLLIINTLIHNVYINIFSCRRKSTPQFTSMHLHFDLQYKDIVNDLFLKHGVVTFTRQLKRHLKNLHPTKGNNFSSKHFVFSFVYSQLQSSGQNHSNRWIFQKCKLNDFEVKREDVWLLLQVIEDWKGEKAKLLV